MDPEVAAWFRERAWPIPFHRFLNFELVSADHTGIVARLDMRPEFCSNVSKNGAMHGGVTATMVDSVCGFLAGIAATIRMRERGLEEETIRQRAARLATVDMHIEYIRMARSERFEASSSILHVGNSIVRTRGQVIDAAGQLVVSAGANYSY